MCAGSERRLVPSRARAPVGVIGSHRCPTGSLRADHIRFSRRQIRQVELDHRTATTGTTAAATAL
jgi:hypothetical protein